ncbi:BTAD domain-containing putative transcriptional regulator [Kribbella sp. NPDC056951]|uniref:BTAD domain-containing putative transcriptional regulator n=1 Tax=Kribbella sp. NPDC056951 TaxID=3345978 RepID=UPI00363F84F7
MFCRVLGPVEVEIDGRPVELGGAVPRRLLAALSTTNRPLPDDELAELVWGAEPPGDIAGALRVVVSRLRTSLGQGGRDQVVRTERGYHLTLPTDAFDHGRFVATVNDAAAALSAGQATDAVRRYQAALELWRGRPWSELDGAPAIAGSQARLDELHAVAVEELAAAQLSAGETATAVAALREAVAATPYRERRWELLALALYRSGRQADALIELRTVRGILADELGIDPGPVLRDLERRMLSQDPTLLPTPTAYRPPAASTAGFFGRTAELEQLMLRSGGFALVTGEPGIGKSALLAQVSGERVVAVRVVDCTEPFWTWGEVVQQLGGSVADLLAGTSLSAEQRFAVFDRFAEYFSSFDGLTILIDDAQWMDGVSLALLLHLVRRRRTDSVKVVVAARAAEFAEREGAAEIQHLISRYGVHLALTGLSADAVAELLASRGVAPEVVAAITERTGGNPLFVEELSGADGVPEVIRDAIRQHLHSLSADCRRMLSAAAVVGRVVDVPVTSALTGRSAVDVLSQLDAALGLQVLVRRGASIEFRHDLLHEVLATDLPLVERAALHLRIAQYREATAPDRVSDIARHRLAALPLGDPAVAMAAAETAATAAVQSLAAEDAASWYEQALALTEPAPADRGRLLLGAGRAWFLSGLRDRAIERCAEAAELAQRAGDAERLARAALALPESPDIRWLPLVQPWCESALAGLSAADSPLRAEVLAQLALTEVYSPDATRLLELSGQALAMAERVADDDALRLALRARQIARSAPEGAGERMTLGERMVRLGRRSADFDGTAWGRLWRFDAMVQLGETQAAWSELEELARVLARLGDAGFDWNVTRSRAALTIASGRFDQGRELGKRVRASTPMGELGGTGLWLQHPVQISTLTGDDFDAEAMMPAVNDHPIGNPSWFIHLAPWYLAQGRPAEAERLYRALAAPETMRPPIFLRLLFEAVRGGVAAELGDDDGCRHAYAVLEPYADLHVTTGAGIALVLGSVQHYLGVTAPDADRAAEHLRAAVRANELAGYEPFAARSRYHLARLEPSAELIAAARDAAIRLGMQPLLTKLDAL